jgi:hypothetical protein
MKFFKTIIFMITVLGCLGIAAWLTSSMFGHASIGNVLADGIKSPEIALERFWMASLSGNENVVNDVSKRPSGDWWNVCDDEGAIVGSDSEYELLPAGNVEHGESGKGRTEASDGRFSGENVPNDLRIFARYIYGSRVNLKRLKIISNQSYEDEALITFEVASYMGGAANSEKFAAGFIKVKNEWKIIGIIQTGVFDFVDDQINYGTNRSLCGQ